MSTHTENTKDEVRGLVENTFQLFNTWNSFYNYMVEGGFYTIPSNHLLAAKESQLLQNRDTLKLLLKVYARTLDVKNKVRDKNDVLLSPYTFGQFALDMREGNKSIEATQTTITRHLKKLSKIFGLIIIKEAIHQGERLCKEIYLDNKATFFIENYLYNDSNKS